MSTVSPSYLFKNRFGKYYFRCRIPIDIRKKYNPSDTDEFFDWLAPFQREAVVVHKNFITKRDREQSVTPQKSSLPNEVNADISQENFADIVVEKMQQAGKKQLWLLSDIAPRPFALVSTMILSPLLRESHEKSPFKIFGVGWIILITIHTTLFSWGGSG